MTATRQSSARTTLLVVALALALVGSVTLPALAAGESATAGDTTLSVDPGSTSVGVGDTTTVDVVVDNAPDGVNGYVLNLSLTDGSAADITGVTLNGGPLFASSDIGPDNNTVSLEGAGTEFSSSSPAVVTVELTGTNAGETDLTIDDATVRDQNSDEYTITGTNSGTLTVTEPSSAVTVTSIEQLGTVERGTTTTINTTVENTGSQSGTRTVEFTLDGGVLDSREVSLSVGESASLAFEVNTSGLSLGTHSYSVRTADDSRTETFDVQDTTATAGVRIDPATANATTDESTTVDVLASVPRGLQGAAFTLSVGNSAVATITDVAVAGSPSLADTNVTDDGSAVTVSLAYLSDPPASNGSLALLSVTLTGNASGETELTLSDVVLSDAENDQYGTVQTTGGTVSVEASVTNPTLPGQDTPAANLDSDPQLEDVNGDGDGNIFDAITLYNSRNSDAVQNNVELFDFTDDGVVDLFDAIGLYNEL